MADENTQTQPEGTEYVLTGSRYVYRDKDNVLVIKKTGDKIRLTKEQADRLNAGKPGSPFQREQDLEVPESDEVAVANEATYEGEDGFKASPDGTRNRRVPAVRREDPDGEQEEAPRPAAGDVPDPTTSVTRDTRTATRKPAPAK